MEKVAFPLVGHLHKTATLSIISHHHVRLIRLKCYSIIISRTFRCYAMSERYLLVNKEEHTKSPTRNHPMQEEYASCNQFNVQKRIKEPLRQGVFNLLPVWAPLSTAIIHCCQIDQHVLCKGYCYVARQCLITPPGLNVCDESHSRGTLPVSALPQPPGHCPHKPLQHLSNWNCTCHRYNVNLKETLDSKELFC